MTMLGAVMTAIVCFAGLPAVVSASAFLEHRSLEDGQWKDLLNELEAALGSGRRAAAETRVAQFEDAMRPVFAALPHLSGDRLASSSVRYLLHRVFVERHGWFVEGLASAGESWNSSSPTAFFAEHAGTEAQGAFEKRLRAQGLSLRETAVFAATLESLVHEETLERLHSTYRVLGLDLHEESSHEHEVELVVDTYMMMLVLGFDHATVAPAVVSRAWENIEKMYPTWGETQKWVREVRKEVVSATPESRTAFNTTVRVLEEVADRYGQWQDRECIDLKQKLMLFEKEGSGRVPLKDFYGAALNGSFQFTERREYLRQLGSLDDSPPQPSVIIANYINGASNCLASSKFYSVCCINECDALMRPLERHIAAPEAPPGRIMELVEQLPSATVDAPRRLPATLIQRLEEIAEQHGGRVPIHGRLFAQWMHHAYPRECPYPHVSGTTQQLTTKQFTELQGMSYSHSASSLEEELEVFALTDSALLEDDVLSSSLPWSPDEEIFFQRPVDDWSGRALKLARWMMMVLAASSMSVVTLRTAVGAQAALGGRATEKYLV